MKLRPEIVADYLRVEAGKTGLSRSEYLQAGKFSGRASYEGGCTHKAYCKAAGLSAKTTEPVSDEVYFQRMRDAVADKKGKLPLQSEQKKYRLNFSPKRWRNLKALYEDAVNNGVISGKKRAMLKEAEEISAKPILPDGRTGSVTVRNVPPIPSRTRRNKWERTGLDGFPYAPQDEQGVVAVFAIACARRLLDLEILEMSNRGIDATCYDHASGKEMRVEITTTPLSNT